MYKSDTKIRESSEIVEVDLEITSGSTKYDLMKKKNVTPYPIHLISAC